jgi:hypothetical protein
MIARWVTVAELSFFALARLAQAETTRLRAFCSEQAEILAGTTETKCRLQAFGVAG